MTVYPLSWIYYLSFIFLTAFIFLNMMVGVILEVMNNEHQAFIDEQTPEGDKPATQSQLNEVQKQIGQLTELIKQAPIK
jgi:voltage-gated sodium channel